MEEAIGDDGDGDGDVLALKRTMVDMKDIQSLCSRRDFRRNFRRLYLFSMIFTPIGN